MGKLAERLADPQRSGVYRVETAEAVEEAAAINRHALTRIALNGARDVRGAFEHALPPPAHGAAGRIVLVSGFEPLLRAQPEEFASMLAAIASAARAWREQGGCCFVAFVDPAGVLASLAPLYHWRR